MNKADFTNPVAMSDVSVSDAFWSNYMELVRTKMLPYQWEALNDRVPDAEPSHCIQNFRIAAGLEDGPFNGFVFQDTDVAKWIEAASFSLIWHPDKVLEQTIDETVDLIVSAQQEDGYLDTYYIINGLEKRWTDIMNCHELYCAGHMLEAAAAYFKATGKRKLLDAMIHFVDYIEQVFGVEEGKIKGYPGHEIIEMALIKLYDITKDEKHLKLARYFIDERGQSPLFLEEEAKENNLIFPWKDSYFKYQYYQAGLPVREQSAAAGHAVRAVYLYSGMADVARKTGDEELYEACKRLWDNMVHRQMYITGAIGSSSYGESFTFDYDLPNDTVYGETCASIGLVFFAHRMLQIVPKGEYADVMEKALYNGILSGVSLDGTKFFYVNPLEVVPEACEKDQLRRHVKPERQKWFGCACCPPNLARMVASLPEYIYTKKDDTLYVHLYVGNESTTNIKGTKVKIIMKSDYLRDGNILVEVSPSEPVEATLAFRIPGWCRKYTVTKNGQQIVPDDSNFKDGYLNLYGTWAEGDVVKLHFEIPVQVVCANPLVRENIGKAAVMRGPVVYCLEEEDNGSYLSWIRLPKAPHFTCTYEKDLLGGIVKLHSNGLIIDAKNWEDSSLYKIYEAETFAEKELVWIPYYAWANRSCGEMAVWIKKE
jgi:DUF1680 family protein